MAKVFNDHYLFQSLCHKVRNFSLLNQKIYELFLDIDKFVIQN